MENHNFLENPLFFRKLNVIQQKDARFWGNSFFYTKSWFHLEPKDRKPETLYRIKYDVGASKNASQAFSTPRLSSHFSLYNISGFRFFNLSIRIFENTGNGFTFDRYESGLLYDAINRAKTLYFENRKCWDDMVIRDMNKDVSWEKSAKQYKDMYVGLTPRY